MSRTSRALDPPRPYALRDYAFVADGERGAVIGPEGDISWLCFPHWDSPAVFSNLIGGQGHYTVSPTERFVWGGYYEEGTLIWHSRWVTNSSIIECQEALAFPGEPGNALLLRRVLAVEGDARVSVVMHPRLAYGAKSFGRLHQDDQGLWSATADELRWRWTGLGDARPETDGHRGHGLVGDITLAEGEHRDLVLEFSEGPLGTPIDPQRSWDASRARWHDTVPRLEQTTARRDARHGYAVLRGLTSTSGAMVAAATTSLPERAEQGRNYDYRYAWIRDQSMAGQAIAAAAGQDALLSDTVGFVVARVLEDGPDLNPAYTTNAGRVPDQASLDLPGYPGGSDRIGNWVNQQFQLDALGESLLLIAAADAHELVDADSWRAAWVAAAAIAERWTDPDAGIWELEPRRWTHSALECVAGLRAISTAPHASAEAAASWEQLADSMLADTARWGTHRSGRWRRAADDDRVDAALLLPAIRGAVAHDDPRAVATFDTVEQLAHRGWLRLPLPTGRPGSW